MRFALLSDIHGNDVALQAVLGDLARLGIDRGVVLSDVAQGGDEPAQVLDRLAELGWPVILELQPRHLEQIRSFHPTFEPAGLLAWRSYDDVLLPETEDDSRWRVEGFALLAGGHTHTQWTRRIGDAHYVNPGSVGVAYDRFDEPPTPRPVAEYAIVTGRSVEFRRCAY